MGGFELYGPNFKIIKINHEHCYCFGYVGEIDIDTEEIFKKKANKVILKSEFISVISNSIGFHIGRENLYEFNIFLRDPIEESKDLYLSYILNKNPSKLISN